MHFCLLLLIVLIFNCLHRLQSILSEIFILIALIISIVYSPTYFSFNCEFFTRIFCMKHCLLNQFFSEIPKKDKILENTVSNESILSNYLLYQKNEVHGLVRKYLISKFDDSFKSLLFRDKSVNSYDIENFLFQYPMLKKLKFGQIIASVVVKEIGLQSVLWRISDTESRIYNRICSSNNYLENIILTFDISAQNYYTIIIGRLHDNFISSARSLGLDSNDIEVIVRALQWQLDFHKLHFGDQFSILMHCTKQFKPDVSNVNKSTIVGIRLRTIGRDYYAFRAENGKFYNLDAINSANSRFMKFPTIKPFRISSNFNLNRLNPVTGRVSPHFGVDFAVPVGTPVISIGDGEVIVSKYGQLSGNYIVIRHGTYCITRYMHLNRLLVKPGQMVKRGENIALSGNTGRSTGPHLHFEIWVNKKPVNPLTVLLNIEKLSGSERINYMNRIHEILPYLSFNQSSIQ